MISFLINSIKIIFLLGLLVFIHEGGHFIVAKLCKVKVNEFAIGFGKTIWKKQGKETVYELKLIPLGGFVRMEGEEEKNSLAGSFSCASIPKRIAIVMAGGMVNIIFGLIIYFCLACFSGSYISNEVQSVLPEYAASIAGIEENDKIIKINNKSIITKKDINEILQTTNQEELTVLVERNNEQIEFKVIPSEIEYGEGQKMYVLGVNMKPVENTLLNRLYYGFYDTFKFGISIVDNLKQLIRGNVNKDQLMGPVGISSVVSETKGIENYIYIIALISLSLGVTNLMPFPPLDGGKIVLLLIEAVRRKPLSQEIENYIQITGFVILITLSVFITYNDVVRIF